MIRQPLLVRKALAPPRLQGSSSTRARSLPTEKAEHGPSLFDARHRFVASATIPLPSPRSSHGLAHAALAGWQLNGIASASSGTPFTVYDSANVSQQGSAPEISGFYGSRPNAISDPNQGPHTPDQWVLASAFQRLDPVANAGQFGNAGRNIVRGPGQANLDLSLLKNWSFAEARQLQFRFEAFNVTNRVNFGIPVNDLVSPNFGRVLGAGSPRVFQAAVKVVC